MDQQEKERHVGMITLRKNFHISDGYVKSPVKGMIIILNLNPTCLNF